jgi:hypothetical protein
MAALISAGSGACNRQKTYRIDYDGKQELFSTLTHGKAPKKAVKDDTVTICFEAVASDTRYEFYLDGERLNDRFDHEQGYIISFLMPDHDVKLSYTKQNLMEVDENKEQGAESKDEAQMYTVDFSGQAYAYLNEPYDRNKEPKPVRTQYRAGEQVVLYYPMIATDTDYTFILDGTQIRPDYERSKGFIIYFTMPDHDVKLQCIESNTMLPGGDDVIIVR